MAAVLFLAAGFVPPAPGAQEGLTLDRLYSLPRLIGTAPTGMTWSPDSARLAFLWNDVGGNFLDVWVVIVGEEAPRRVTTFEQPRRFDEGAGVDAIRHNQTAEQDTGVGAVNWFPDNEHLLARVGATWYRVAMDGTAHPLEFTGGRPQFAPDGRSIAYLAGGELWVATVTGTEVGEGRRLTTLSGSGRGVARYAWSPNGRAIAVVERDSSAVRERGIPDYLGGETELDMVRRAFPGEEPGRTRLHVVDVEDGATRPMQLGPDDRDLLFSLDWSADGARLLVDTSDLYVKDRQVRVVDAVSGESALLYREQEPANVMAFWQAQWAPDGRGALVLSDRDDRYHVYRVTHGADPVAITRGEWAVESFAARDDGILLTTNRSHPAERQLERIGLDGGEPQRLSRRSGTHEAIYSPDGRWAAVRFSSDTTPPELFLNRLGSGDETRITQSPLPDFYAHEWVEPDYVTFRSHVDDTLIHGRLMLPADFDPSVQYPAIIGSVYSNSLRNQWGGRNAHPVWGLDQYLLDQGYILLNVNIRGSWGLGRDFRRRMQYDYGGIDTEDIYSAVGFLAGLGYVDIDRVGLWGSSYGGLMTAMSLFKRPGVFAAGVAGAPATNVWHATTGEMRVMGPPDENPDAYAASSAFTHASTLADPLMIIHGMRDRIVLFKDSLVLLEHLMLYGKADLVEFVPLPNSPHGWDTMELYQTRYAFKKLAAHFDRYLKQ